MKVAETVKSLWLMLDWSNFIGVLSGPVLHPYFFGKRL